MPLALFVENFTDKYGLIVQTDGDGGDSLNRHGLLGIIMSQYDEVSDTTKDWWHDSYLLYQRVTNEYVRHPKPNTFWSDPALTSRDQMIPNWIAWGLHAGENDRLLEWWTSHKKRLLFFQNNRTTSGKWRPRDITSPVHLASILRSLNKHKWLIWILDWFLFISTLETIKKCKDPNHSDIINAFCIFYQTTLVFPTWQSKQAAKLLIKNVDIQSKLDHYFRAETHAPPFGVILKTLVDDFKERLK